MMRSHVKTNLIQRQITINANCEECQSCPKKINHALWSCQFAQALWNLDPIFQELHAACAQNFLDLFWFAKEKIPNLEMTKFATIAWALWQRQKSFRVTRDGKLPSIVFRKATDFLQEYQEANTRSLSSLTHPIIQVRWSPPPYDMFKINFD